MVSIEPLAATEGCLLGEGPHWDTPTQSLYFVDCFGNAIVKYTPETNTATRSHFDRRLPFIIPVANRKDEFIISLANELVVISWNGENDEATILRKLCALDSSKIFNDAKCDSSGRLWIGAHTIEESDVYKTQPLGTLYSLDSSKPLEPHVDKIRVSNGIAFNEKAKKMFFIDSLDRTVYRFDFDIATGAITNRQAWFNFEKSDVAGYPDGMTIDIDGNLWVACVGGCRVIKVDGSKPETLLQTVNIPADQVTSVTFGGRNLDELYVTTGNMPWAENGPTPTANGATFKVTGLGTRGLPAPGFKLD